MPAVSSSALLLLLGLSLFLYAGYSTIQRAPTLACEGCSVQELLQLHLHSTGCAKQFCSCSSRCGFCCTEQLSLLQQVEIS